MNKFFRFAFLAVALPSFTVLSSCDDEDPPLPDNIVAFQATTQGLAANETDLTVNISLARAVETAGNVTISYVPTDLSYGDDFTTEPAADANNKIVIPVAAGATTASFKVTKTNTTGLQGSEKVVFTIESVGDGLVLGDQKTFTLSFSEIIATDATMQINGGGTNAQNRVFIDLSANRQTAVGRTTWDLAFSSKADEFRVYLNSSNKMLAHSVDKTDIAAVTSADITAFVDELDYNAVFAALTEEETPEWVLFSYAWVDSPTDPEVTAIAAVDEDEDNNLVYIVNRGYSTDNSALGKLKIRVIRDGSNYTLQYAEIDSEEFKTISVPKNASTDLTYVSLTTENVVTVEPASGEWDIAWTGFTNTLPFGPGMGAPYYFSDFILQNTNGVSTAEILTADIAYDAYAESDIDGTTFVGDDQTNIGSKWRTLPQDGSAPSVNSDRFYVIKDADGNVYKLQFTALLVNGERGKPEFKFELVKKGA